MRMKKALLSAFIDSFVQSIILHFVCTVSVSVYAESWTLDGHILAFALAAIVAFGIFYAFKNKVTDWKRAFGYLAFYMLLFPLLLLSFAFVRIAIPFGILPMRETNAADRLVLFAGMICYFLISAFLRLCIVICRILRFNHSRPRSA